MKKSRKRIDSAAVSNMIWDELGRSQARNIRNGNQSSSRHRVSTALRQTEAQAEEEVGLLTSQSMKPMFEFENLGVQSKRFKFIITEKTKLGTRKPPETSQKMNAENLINNLKVEQPIESKLYVFKRHIVSSKNIEKAIENNTYLSIISDKRKAGRVELSVDSSVNPNNDSGLIRPFFLKGHPDKNMMSGQMRAPELSTTAGGTPSQKIQRPQTTIISLLGSAASSYNPGVGGLGARPVTSKPDAGSKFSRWSKSSVPRPFRPSSSVNSMISVRQMFSGLTRAGLESGQRVQEEVHEPIFNFQEQTIFVTQMAGDSLYHSRPSGRIGMNIQHLQRFRFEHLERIINIRKFSSLLEISESHIPLQLVYRDPNFPSDVMPNSGVCYLLPAEQIFFSNAYSLFPEFIDNETLDFYGVPHEEASTLNFTNIDRKFKNRELLHNYLVKAMKGTYDPAFYINTHGRSLEDHLQGLVKRNSQLTREECEDSARRFALYASEEFMPREYLPKFSRKWLLAVLSKFSEGEVQSNEEFFKNTFGEIFESFAEIQRRGILEYILVSPLERRRLKIAFPPSLEFFSSQELIARNGGYHSRIFESWHNYFINCRSFLEREERLLQGKTIAVKSWLAEFEDLPLFDSKIPDVFSESSSELSIQGFLGYQIFYLSVLQIFFTSIFKRGLLALVAKDIYLKPVNLPFFGKFHIFGHSSAAPGKAESFFQAAETAVLNLIRQQVDNGKSLAEAFTESIVSQSSSIKQSMDSNRISDIVYGLSRESIDLRNVQSDPTEEFRYDKRVAGIVCLLIKDFIKSKLLASFEAIHKFLSEKLKAFRQDDLLKRPLVTLEVRCEGEGFQFENDWESIERLFRVYFDKLTHFFDFIFDIFEQRIEIRNDETLTKLAAASSGPQIMMSTNERDKNERNISLKEISDLFNNYVPRIWLQPRAKVEQTILTEIKNFDYEDLQVLWHREHFEAEVVEVIEPFKTSSLTLLKSDFDAAKQSFEGLKPLVCLLLPCEERQELSSLISSVASRVSALGQVGTSGLTIKGSSVKQVLPLQIERQNNEELVAFRSRITFLMNQIESQQPKKGYGVFMTKSVNVLRQASVELLECQSRMSKRLNERLLIQSKHLIKRYQSFVDFLRLELNKPADYANLREFFVELSQEKLLMTRKSKAIFEEANFYLRSHLIGVNLLDALETMRELSLLDSELQGEMERSSERASVKKAEFERRLKDDKMMFQIGCSELLESIQILKSINDLRNFAKYLEEVHVYDEQLKKLREYFEEINSAEIALYEREFKTDLFFEIEDLLLPNVEAWEAAHAIMNFIKKIMNTHVSALDLGQIEAFIQESTENIGLLSDRYVDIGRDNLVDLVTDLRRELADFSSFLPQITQIVNCGLRPDQWQAFFARFDPELEPAQTSLKVFLSFYNETSKVIFDQVCDSAAFERQIEQELSSLIQNFQAIVPVVQERADRPSLLNSSAIFLQIEQVLAEAIRMEALDLSEGVLAQIQSFKSSVIRIKRGLTRTTELQERIERLEPIFRTIEFRREIEREYKDFFEARDFLKAHLFKLQETGFDIFSNESLHDKLLSNICRAEIIENHKSPWLYDEAGNPKIPVTQPTNKPLDIKSTSSVSDS